MLIDLTELVRKHDMHISGVLHVGAHECEEAGAYAQLGIQNVIWVEANPALCGDVGGGRFVHHAVVSNVDKAVVDFIITNNGQSSSIMELLEHKIEHPHVVEVRRMRLKTTTINTLLSTRDMNASTFNFVNLDIQGAELLALQGMSDHIGHVDYVYTEVNTKELYKGNALLSEVDAFLEARGFERKDTAMTPHGWGDAFYVRTKPQPTQTQTPIS